MSDSDAWRELKIDEPRVAMELEEVRTCHLLHTTPLPGGLKDQRARFVGAMKYMMETGFLVERAL